MFIERLKKSDLESKFLPAFSHVTGFNQMVGNIVFRYKDLATNCEYSLILTDFKINEIDDNSDYLKFMQNLFGTEYEHEYFLYKTKN